MTSACAGQSMYRAHNLAPTSAAELDQLSFPQGVEAGSSVWTGRSAQSRRNEKRILGLLLVGILVFLAWASSYLSAVRIYQVDECQNLYMARVLVTGGQSEFFTNASLFLLGPLAWVTKANINTEQMFAWSRLLFLMVFWLNIYLLARVVSEKIFSIKGLLALVGAATLAPLWDYGFEVRHDNLLLTGMLLIWWSIRVKPMELASYVMAGAITITMLFIAVKSVVYVLPLSFAILAFPPPVFRSARWRLGLAWTCGVVLATAIIRLCYGSAGGWDVYFSVFHDVTKYSASAGAHGSRFGPWFTLSRLPGQTPLLLALTASASIAILAECRRRGRLALTWEGNLPEFLLFAGVLAALGANPTPFPYNLLHLVPYAFLLAFRYASVTWESIRGKPNLFVAGICVVICSHLMPFGVNLKRHFEFSNQRQNRIAKLAEDLTDPLKDPVYDGIGMVLTRTSINYNWYLHSLNIERFISGNGPKPRDMLAERPAAVLIPSYRTDWLPEADHEFIRQRYVNLSDDFCVLGQQLPVGGGQIEIYHPGRYRISALKDSNIAGTYSDTLKEFLSPPTPELISGSVDEASLPDAPVELSKGKHRILSDSSQPLAVVWVGPKLDRPPRSGSADHQKLFVNWY